VAWWTRSISLDCEQSLLSNVGDTFYGGVLAGSDEIEEIWCCEGIIVVVEVDCQRIY